MRNVKVFMAPNYLLPGFEERLSKKYNIAVHRKQEDCDVSLIMHGSLVNPLVFKTKRVLLLFFLKDDQLWKWAFSTLYGPVVKHYYDEIVNLTHCTTEDELADRTAEEVKRLENETD